LSNIVCKFFIDAVQRKQYGYKWDCPNGDECHYKHCLPEGYIMTSKNDRMQEEMTMEEYYNLEENIDEEREVIGKNGTPVNDITFAEWKQKRDEFRQKGKDLDEKKKKKETGMQLFRNQANIFKDDENAEGNIEREDDNQLEDDTKDNTRKNTGMNDLRTENEIMDDLDNDLKGVKINAELFQEDENLDDLNDVEDDVDIEEETKETHND